jgi:outer membrane lipoprotein SlyB
MRTECPHCGATLPPTGDAICPECFEGLDEPTAAQQAVLRAVSGDTISPARRQVRMRGAVIGACFGMLAGAWGGGPVAYMAGRMTAAVLLAGVVGWVIGDIVGRRR